MATHRYGKQSFKLKKPPVIAAWASVAGKKESEGPLASYFDYTTKDTYFGQKTWEQAERKMQQMALDTLSSKANIDQSSFGIVLSGDLLNQCIGSSFSIRNKNLPHLGLYGACSTMAEALLIGSMIVDGDYSDGRHPDSVKFTSDSFTSGPFTINPIDLHSSINLVTSEMLSLFRVKLAAINSAG